MEWGVDRIGRRLRRRSVLLAWAAGGGDTDHGRIDQDVLRSHYEDVNFLRSVTVDVLSANPEPMRRRQVVAGQ